MSDINYWLALNVGHRDCHKAADAFWDYWKANGETHRHGYYESTWGAINQAIKLVGVRAHDYGQSAFTPTDHAQLMKHYGVTTLEALVDMQSYHIEKLQAKLPQAPSFAPQRVREG